MFMSFIYVMIILIIIVYLIFWKVYYYSSLKYRWETEKYDKFIWIKANGLLDEIRKTDFIWYKKLARKYTLYYKYNNDFDYEYRRNDTIELDKTIINKTIYKLNPIEFIKFVFIIKKTWKILPLEKELKIK
jgi:hypothetical protein